MKKEINYRKQYDDLDSGITYALAIIIPIAIGLILTLIFNSIASSKGIVNAQGVADFSQSPTMYTIYMIIVSCSLLGIFFVYNKVARIDFKQASLLKLKFGWVNAGVCIVIALVTLFGFNYLISYLTHLMSLVGYNPDSSLPLPLDNAGWLILNLFVLAVIPAICEEFIYRGMILNGFRKFGSIAAIFISALFFALAHGSAMQFFYQFVLGVVLAAVVIKTGSIIASMVVHFVNNATVLIYNYIYIQTGTDATTAFTPGMIVLSFALALAAGILLWFLIAWLRERKIKILDNSQEATDENLSKELSANEQYSVKYTKENRGFSSNQSKLAFGVALAISVALWAVGTFFA